MSTNHMIARGRVALQALALAAALVACLVMSQAARADFGFSTVDAALLDTAGNPDTQAGSHPDLSVAFDLNSMTDPATSQETSDGQLRNLVVDMPKGFYGNPQAVPQCPREVLELNFGSGCPASSIVGTIGLHFAPGVVGFSGPLYNVTPGDGQAAVFAANIVGGMVSVVSTVGNDGVPHIRASIKNINEGIKFFGATMTLWGVPADPVHDGVRGGPSSAIARPLLTAPSDCTQQPVVRLHAESWELPVSTDDISATLPTPTGCDAMKVSHGIAVEPLNPKVDSPSGYDIDLTVPQDDRPSELGVAPLKRVEVTLPEGVALSPAAASAVGLTGCSDAQLNASSDAEPECPSSSKIGTLSITTPLLSDDLTGTVYLGAPTADAMFRLFLVANGPGVLLKIPGTAQPDPATGQIKAVFDNLPELPFSALHMHLKGGDTAPLANPQTCGTKTVTSNVTAWAGAQSAASGSFTISADGQGGACASSQPFAPTFEAGMTDSGAGLFSAFTMTVRRNDGDQDLSKISVALPSGLLGILTGIPQCPEGSATAGTCDASSQVGTVTVESGSGDTPLPLTGKVFLGGAYKGSPYSLAIVVHAAAGPFDLGTVVVRAPLNIDAAGAKVAVPADALPTILRGVPLRLRMINITLDRPNFMFNATSCATSAIGATLTSVGGATVTPSSRYQVTGCAGLPLSPALALRLTGGVKQLAKNGHPGVEATLTQDAGESGLKTVAVTLPSGVSVDLKNLGSICKAADAAARKCADAAIVGHAAAKTAALPTELAGPVYLVEGTSKDPKTGKAVPGLPQLWLKLEGGGVPLDLWAQTSISHGRLTTTFANIPDAPITSFKLQIDGGAKGILQTVSNQCAARRAVPVVFTGQTGRVLRSTLKAGTDCAPRIARTRVSSSSVALTVSGIGAGRLSVSGGGVRRASRAISKADVATIVAKLSSGARARLAEGGTVHLHLTVAYKPVSGGTVTLHKSVTIRG